MPAAAVAPTNGDDVGTGEVRRQSDETLREDRRVSCDELDEPVEAARLRGCADDGAGFGGCTVHLVRADAVDDFIAATGHT